MRKSFKEYYKDINENEVKLIALQELKGIQSELTTINFLNVLSAMSPENPLVKDVQIMETSLADLRKMIEEFMLKNQFDYVGDEENTKEDKKDEV